MELVYQGGREVRSPFLRGRWLSRIWTQVMNKLKFFALWPMC